MSDKRLGMEDIWQDEPEGEKWKVDESYFKALEVYVNKMEELVEKHNKEMDAVKQKYDEKWVDIYDHLGFDQEERERPLALWEDNHGQYYVVAPTPEQMAKDVAATLRESLGFDPETEISLSEKEKAAREECGASEDSFSAPSQSKERH